MLTTTKMLEALARIREARCEIARMDVRLTPVHVIPDRKQVRDSLEFLEAELGTAMKIIESEVG